jgi:poly(hydroxyalkanoate) depolymerase family esterase
MLHRYALGAALAICIAAPGCGLGDEGVDSTSADLSQIPNPTDWASGTNWTYQDDFMGLPRAWVYRPTSFSQKSPTQRAVFFHLGGCGAMPFQAAQGAGWPEAAEAAGMVVVIPDTVAPAHPNQQAPNVSCYDFGSGLASEPTSNSPDHKALIAAAKKIVTDPDLKIDPRQVYVGGFSAGATVAMQVACMAPDVFAGVASVAGPSIGTDQSKSVMPPQSSASQVQSKCTSYAGALKDKLGTQLYAVISDNNGLPAGNPVMDSQGHWTADKFQKQTIWDGDKYTPHVHHDYITGAMAQIMNVRQTSTQVDLGLSGTGRGCPGGERSHDDTAETDCNPGHDATPRNWNAKADIWTDAQGRKRIVRIQQDTLRHRWPSGPAGAHDATITPTFQDVINAGLFDTNSGLFVVDKVDQAPNGELGGLYFGNDTFDLPMFLVDFFANNNPRLGTTSPTSVAIDASATVDSGATTSVVSGSVTAPGTAHVASVTVTFQGNDHAATIDSGKTQVSFSVSLPIQGLSSGSYTATVKATDDAGHQASSDVSFRVGGGDTTSCFTTKNSAHITAGRAYYGLAFHAYAKGSNTDLGNATFADDPTTSLSEQSSGYWVKVDSCP